MKSLVVKTIQSSYPIHIKKGIFNNIGQDIKKIYNNKKIAVITDLNVYALYGEEIRNNLNQSGFNVKIIKIEPGEKSKSIIVLQNIYDELLDFKITRDDLIIAFGGGVVGDITGFAAATLLRGIPFIQIPTSLLAQIDSSIGGKVAVNLPKGKNLVGSFYSPKVVFIDPNLLNSLDKRFIYDGMAEVIKYACIRDEEMFNDLLEFKNQEELFQNIEDIIYKCCKIKKEIVEEDERDKGERMVLNFGHTLGHAVEKYFKYEKYTHGEAVAIGMYNITKRSEDIGITKKGTLLQIKKILNKYSLPFKLPDMNKDRVNEVISLDKKNMGNVMSIVLLKQIGYGIIKKIDKTDRAKYI